MKKGLKNTGRIIVILILAFLAILIFFALSLSNKLGASQDFYRNLTKGKNNLETAFNLVQGGAISMLN